MSEILLFTYGLLKPEYEPPKTAKNFKRDAIFGNLYDLGYDAAAVNIGKSDDIIFGYVLTLDKSELSKIDKEERVEYKRLMTKTLLGQEVFAYEYEKKIPEEAQLVNTWFKK